MKRFLALLLAALMLLSCIPVLAESADDPYLVKEMGLRLTMDLQYDVLDKIDNSMSLSIDGVFSHAPFCSTISVAYCTLTEEYLAEKQREIEAAEDPEKRSALARESLALFVGIGEIAATELADPQEYLTVAGWNADKILGITEFATLDKYHWYYITLPVDDVIARYDELHAFGEDDAEAQAAREKARAEIEFCQAGLLEYLKSLEVVAPVDPDGAYIGRVIEFESTDLDGNPVTSADLFKDNEITMVNLWGTWCPNCVNEMAELAQIHTRLQEKGCGIVGIEFEQKPIEQVEETARAIMTANGTNYPSVLMPKDNALLNETLYYPTTYFVDSEGKILTFSITGAAVSEYEAVIDKLLASEKLDTADDTGAAVNDGNKYCVYVFDQDGNPVEGTLVQFCDDATCAFQPTDADGVATFPVSEQKVYEIHLLSVPEGYKEDSNVYKTLDTFSNVNIFLEKAE